MKEQSTPKELISYPDKIFYVSSEDDDTVLIAINFEIDVQGRLATWFDTNKIRMMEYLDYEEKGESIIFTRNDSNHRKYTLEELTLEIYRSKVREELKNPNNYDNLGELYQALRDTCKSY